MREPFLLLLILVLQQQPSASWSFSSPGHTFGRPWGCNKGRTASSCSSTTRLFYRNEDAASNSNNGDPQQQQRDQPNQPHTSSSSTTTTTTIPVLGPFLEQPPLIPGTTFTLHDPTPLQCQALAAAVRTQHNTTASTAPLVALLDSYTVHGPDRGRYATIAAAIGYTAKESFDDETCSIDHTPSAVVLLGVGRAVLTDFEYVSKDAEHYHDDTSSCSPTTSHPVVVAHWHVVHDTVPTTASPVHAATACAHCTRQLHYLHTERQRYVREIVAHNAHLHEDIDGIGGPCAFTPFFALQQLSNYGLGHATPSVATLPSLTNTTGSQLAPYYYDSHDNDRLYYETFSWTALHAIQPFVEPAHVAWAVRCQDTAERLHVIAQWMTAHVQLLRQCGVEE